ncbi:Gfo/Idh/MocA family oxidoreductase [Actinocrinis puniceicyclus]|uniref:Gfo/Idh/MocA family oxidoreductase n=1 Tax=Actinocrinis puniceicyclus TaxID=977794 RepID=A0A8J7WMB0_9ACTN|nr:Gfo/Idh/MocA family oxidoreductase [Actinocrinis puniceicyclus]MBS2963410.1 Gfo/Idh/MocA family oxidoreductase [Actinocrinis puniceicyclus]
MTTTSPTTFGIIGSGWRAEFFVRLAALLPQRLTLVGAAVRREQTAQHVAANWHVPAYLSPQELFAKQRPEFVVASVSWPSTPVVTEAAVEAGIRVLAETPPAPDADGLRALWQRVGARRMVQIAEQYLLLPGHAARREIVRRGVIGRPTSVQVSSTHGYHAVSMMRGLLGAGFEPTSVSASRFSAPLLDPLTRDGWSGDETPKDAETTLATLDFGDGRSGLYDFTSNQWHNRLRARRIVIRASHGEITDDTVVRWGGPRTVLRSQLLRSQLGHDLNLDGHDTEHLSFDGEVVYRNPFLGLRLMDEEIAIASILTATADWARDEGPQPYPLAEACQDHLLALAIDRAAETGERVTTQLEPWAA